MNEEKKLRKVLKSNDLQLINSFFDEIYNKYRGLVCFVISRYVKNDEDVFDLAQDVFVSFFNNADKINNNIKYYLTTSAKNHSLNYLRKNNKIVRIEDIELDDVVDIVYDNNDSYSFYFLIKILKKELKENEFKVLSMHLFDNLTFKQISKKLNVKESTIKTLYYRTICKCKSIMERGDYSGK